MHVPFFKSIALSIFIRLKLSISHGIAFPHVLLVMTQNLTLRTTRNKTRANLKYLNLFQIIVMFQNKQIACNSFF